MYDRTLNDVLTKALFDPWQEKSNTCASRAQNELEHESCKSGLQVSLTTAIEARFVSTLVTRNGVPDYVPLTTNLGLKYKRRMLYFPMDVSELTLDGLVDTRALSSAVPEADLRKILLLDFQSIVERAQHPLFKSWKQMGSGEHQRALAN